MNSQQIHRALKTLPVTSGTFMGVFPSDQLPAEISLPTTLVVNTDPADQPGQHWVAMYMGADGTTDYFDSYGMSPSVPSIKDFLHDRSTYVNINPKQVQGYLSSVCGHYCIYFLTLRCHSVSMADIVRPFHGDFRSDSFVCAWVNKHFRLNTETFEDELVVNQLCTAFGV